MLRPRPARWFEILTARDDATLVLEALARTGAVELETRPGGGLPDDLGVVMPVLTQFLDLSSRYGAYWPAAAGCRPSAFPEAPLAAMERCVGTVRAWAQDAEPVIRALQRGDAESAELHVWQRVLAAAGPVDIGRLAAAGPLVQVRLYVLPAGVEPQAALGSMPGGPQPLVRELLIDGAPHLLVAGTPSALQALAQRASTLKGSSHDIPAWLRGDPAGAGVAVRARLAELAQARADLVARLQALSDRHDLPRALGDAHRLHWVIDNVHGLESGPLLCWITGWSSDAGATALTRALQSCPARALLRHAAPPAGARAPLLLSNPPWARPFEIFSRALGMPASAEADPSTLLAIAVPLMFGYMFGDVGQGLLLAVVAWWFRGRYAVARLLMVGGLSAAVFGLLFGSVFSLHGLLPALWRHPLDAPLPILVAPVLGGALLLTLGLGLDALAAWWRGEIRQWLLADAALLAVYIGLQVAVVDPAGLWLAALGALGFCAGHALQARRFAAALRAIGELVERTLQILINTVSFARVGAFALAHAGLSSAIVSLMDAADSGVAKALVLVLGNALVIVLEALVVSIQTTRLVLFEFFTRFMRGQGRAFRPLPAPPFTYQEP